MYFAENGHTQSTRPTISPTDCVPSLAVPPVSSLPPINDTVGLFAPPYSASPAPVEVDERVVRRKLKHKLLDSERRRRENAALQSLARLTAASNNGAPIATIQQSQKLGEARKSAVAEQSVVERSHQSWTKRRRGVTSGGLTFCVSEHPAGESDSTAGTEQLTRVDVLERTVTTLDEAIADNHKKDRRIATLQCQLHAVLATLAKKQPMPPTSNTTVSSAVQASDDSANASLSLSPAALTFVSALDRTQCLSLRSFVRPLISLLSASLPHFRIVDANSAHRKLTGWSDDLIVNKLLAWSLSKDEKRRSDVAAIVKKVIQKRTQKHSHTGHDNTAERGEQRTLTCGCIVLVWCHLRQVHTRENGDVWIQKATQYPASGIGLRELLRGNKEKADVVWRMYKSDGRLYEIECTFWLGGAVPVDAADEWCDDEDDISALNSNRDSYSGLRGIEVAEKRLAGRYLIIAAAWQEATEASGT